MDNAGFADLDAGIDGGQTGVVVEVDAEYLVVRGPLGVAPLQRVVQDVADDHHVLHGGVGHRRAIGVRAAAPALQNRVVQHVDESQAEVPAGPHGAGAAPVDERGDVVVVDVTLSAVPSL